MTSVGRSSLFLKHVVPSTLVRLIDGYSAIRMLNRPVAAATGLNFLDPACTENSARRRLVWVMVVESSFGDELGLSESISTDGGFFFDVTDVQSDMTLSSGSRSGEAWESCFLVVPLFCNW